MSARWKPIAGTGGSYEVSDYGDVRSTDGVDTRGRRRTGCTLRQQTTARGGHRYVTLRMQGRKRNVYVHRLVLDAFVGPCPPGLEPRHGNGHPADNRLANLQWDTRSENTRDRVRHGTHHETVKTHCPAGHPYQGANLLRDGRRRRCRTCRTAQRKAAAR